MARLERFPKIEGGYFLVPNAYFDETAELSHAEFRLLMGVCRYTLGWGRLEAPIAHPILSERTGLHQTSIRRGMLRLQDAGFVRLAKRMVRGRELNVFEPVLPVAAPEAPGASVSPCVVHGDPMRHACHAETVPSNEGKKEQQQARPAEAKPPSNPTPHPAAVPIENDLTEEQALLLARMREVGVGRTMALRLIGSRPAEVIEEALDNLPHRKARRPAALLVRELQEGGWELPREVAQEQQKREAEESRRAEQQAQAERERQEADAAEERFRAAWDALDGARRNQALEEARKRVAWAAHLPGALEEGSPLLAGALREVMAEWVEAPPPPDVVVVADSGMGERREGTVVSPAAPRRRPVRAVRGPRRLPALPIGSSGGGLPVEVRC